MFDNYFTEMQHCIQRLASLDKEVEKLAESETYKEVVGLLRCFHGIDIADRAGLRLRKRYWYLINRGKMPCKATVAVARDLAGFIWSVFKEYQARNQEKAA